MNPAEDALDTAASAPLGSGARRGRSIPVTARPRRPGVLPHAPPTRRAPRDAVAERNAHAARRSAVQQALGRNYGADVMRPLSFVPELEDALGGGTIRETMPIIQR